MFKKLANFIRKAVGLYGEIERGRAEIKELRADLSEVNRKLIEIAVIVKQLQHSDDQERIAVKIENVLLRTQPPPIDQRTLPPMTSDKTVRKRKRKPPRKEEE